MKNPKVTRTLEIALSERQEEFTKLFANARKRLKRGTVHDLRTSCRRLIAALCLFESLESPVKIKKACRELKDLMHALRSLRDLQVEQKRINAEITGIPAGRELSRTLRRDEKREKRAVQEAMRDFKPRVVRREVEKLVRYLKSAAKLESTFEGDLRELASQHLRNQYQELLAAVRAVPPKSPPPLALHEVRIQFKRFRYAWELVSPIVRKAILSETTLQEFQTLLGKIQDLHVLLSSIIQFADPELVPYSRSLLGQEKRLVRRFLKRLGRMRPRATFSRWPGSGTQPGHA